MDFLEAQSDMRDGYYGGGPGALASGLVWITAGIMAAAVSEQASMLTFFFGGMVIYPLGNLFAKMLKRPGKHTPGNPLGTLAIETTFLLFIGLFLAFLVAQFKTAWFYPVMLTMIGGRYLMFTTLYGLRIYWVFGALLIVTGVSLVFLSVGFSFGAFAGGLIEILFSVLIVQRVKMG